MFLQVYMRKSDHFVCDMIFLLRICKIERQSV